jgi:hypothetical protein
MVQEMYAWTAEGPAEWFGIPVIGFG